MQVCRIEKGVNRVRDLDKLIRWAWALGIPASYAWFELPDEHHVSAPAEQACSFEEKQPAEEEDVKRRALLAQSLVAGAAVATGLDPQPWERLTVAMANPARLTATDVDELEHQTLDYFRREEFVPARQLAKGLRQHIERLSRLLSGGVSDTLRVRLLSTIGEAMALYGWFAFDRNDKATAHRFYGLAASAAHDAGDDALAACVLGYRSYLAESTGDQAQAREMLAAAQRQSRAPSSAATRAWLAARESEVRATMSEGTDALRALDRATTAFDYARPQHERAWTAFFTSSRLGSMAVTTYTHLSHPRLGATADSVLAGLGPDDAKIKAIILADLAT
ncbi:MAG: hypothetical protein ACRDJ9_34020, partial [Dehalococcoidia bacterium]